MEIRNWIKDHAATLLSWGATAGTIGGSILSAKAVSKAIDRMDEAREKKQEALAESMNAGEYSNTDIWEAVCNVELTTWEKIKAGGPAFIPTILVEAATIGCIHGSNILNKQEINKARDLLAVAVAGAAAYKESIGVITDRTTEFAADKRLQMMEESRQNGDPPWDQKQLFCIEGRDECFERTMEEVFEAEYLANRAFALNGTLCLNELYQLFGLSEVNDSLIYDRDGDCMGWNDYIGEVYYGYHWIDFVHRRKPLPDGRMVTEICLPFGPHPLDEDVVNDEIDQAITELNHQQYVRMAERSIEKMAHG